METRYEEEVFLEIENFDVDAKATYYLVFDYNAGGYDEPSGHYLESLELDDFDYEGFTKDGNFLELSAEQRNLVEKKLEEHGKTHEDEIFENALEQM